MSRREGEGENAAKPGLEQLIQRLEALEGAVDALSDAVVRLLPNDGGATADPDRARAQRDLLDAHVPRGENVAVASPDALGPAGLRRDVAPLPTAGGGAGAIASVEARRAEGLRFLLAPDASSPHDAELMEHLRTRYPIVAEADGGILFDLEARREGEDEAPSVTEVLGRLCGRQAPVLDWTDLELARLVPGRNVFAPLEPGDSLPYLDGTIEVVVVDDELRLEEAARVASAAAVLVTPVEEGPVVVAVRESPSEDAVTDAVLLLALGDSVDGDWVARVAEAASEYPSIMVEAADDPFGSAAATDADLVVVAEPGVLPLPGCIAACAQTLAGRERVGGVAVKLLAPDGSLEAAGTAVFADGTLAGIAAGAPTAAPWHEYVRPVDAGTGLVALRSEALRVLAGPREELEPEPERLTALLRGAGWEVLYQPEALAVRALPREDEPGPLPEEALEPLGALPERPEELNARTWRRLLAVDYAEAVPR